MMNSPKSLLKDFFPIWFSWYLKLNIPETQRAGKPRKAVLPIGGKKYRAAAMMLLFPRGIQTANKIAKEVGSSGGTVRNWMTEDRFKSLAKDLEGQFATHVLEKLHDKRLSETLQTSHDEIGSWSDGILRTLVFNIDREVGVGGSLDLTLSERLLKAQGLHAPGKGGDLEPVVVPRMKVPKPSRPNVKEMWRDISHAALESYQVWPKSKRGPRPQEIRERERSALYRFAVTLEDHLQELDRALKGKKSKVELQAMVKTARLILYNMMEELKV